MRTQEGTLDTSVVHGRHRPAFLYAQETLDLGVFLKVSPHSAQSIQVAWCTVGKDPESVRKVTEVLEGPGPADTLAVVEDGDGNGPSAPPLGVKRLEHDRLTMATPSSHESEALLSSNALKEVMMREPLLGDSCTSGTSS